MFLYFMKNQVGLAMQMWINTDFDVIVQDVDQPAFAYPLSPSPLTQECFTYCRCEIKYFDIVSGVIFNFTSHPLLREKFYCRHF